MVEPAYEAAMLRELARIATAIPQDELAIQWDTAIEFSVLEGVHVTGIAITDATCKGHHQAHSVDSHARPQRAH